MPPTNIDSLTSGGISAPAQTPGALAIPSAANVAAPAAVTAADPAAITAATPATTVGSALGAFTDPPSAAEMGALRTFVNALKTDVAALKAEYVKTNTDLAAVRTQFLLDLDDMVALRATLAAEIAALKAAPLQASS